MDSKALDCPTLSAKDRAAGESRVVLIGDIEVLFRWCPADMFMMGTTKSKYEVKLTKGFWIMETPVTVGMFEVFVDKKKYKSVGDTPFGLVKNKKRMYPNKKFSWENPGYEYDNDYPVTCISWFDAKNFCDWLSEEKRLKMRLPTEAEWEYACRSGKAAELLTIEKLKEIAWIPENSDNQAHPVGKDSHYNTWHICDMIGNVREWCYDAYSKYPNGSVTNPKGPKDGKLRIVRGGSWASELKYCQSTGRLSYAPSYKSSYQGFRVVCEGEQ